MAVESRPATSHVRADSRAGPEKPQSDLRAGSGAPRGGHTDPSRWLGDHGDVLWRYAMIRLRSEERAEDILQETFAAALAARASFRGECSERTWLLSILRRKVVDHLRASRRETPVESAALADFDEKGKWRVRPRKWPDDPHALLASPEFWATLEECLAELPPGVGDAFVLRELRSAPAAAVCGAMRITVNNLWVRLHRARMLLRRCITRKWAPDHQRSRR
jgi:RNA polymerase sigma-70 factor, ECF subfamily